MPLQWRHSGDATPVVPLVAPRGPAASRRMHTGTDERLTTVHPGLTPWPSRTPCEADAARSRWEAAATRYHAGLCASSTASRSTSPFQSRTNDPARTHTVRCSNFAPMVLVQSVHGQRLRSPHCATMTTGNGNVSVEAHVLRRCCNCTEIRGLCRVLSRAQRMQVAACTTRHRARHGYIGRIYEPRVHGLQARVARPRHPRTGRTLGAAGSTRAPPTRLAEPPISGSVQRSRRRLWLSQRSRSGTTSAANNASPRRAQPDFARGAPIGQTPSMPQRGWCFVAGTRHGRRER